MITLATLLLLLCMQPHALTGKWTMVDTKTRNAFAATITERNDSLVVATEDEYGAMVESQVFGPATKSGPKGAQYVREDWDSSRVTKTEFKFTNVRRNGFDLTVTLIIRDTLDVASFSGLTRTYKVKRRK